MQSIEIPGLAASERAFLLDSGERVVVRITRQDTIDGAFLHMKGEGRLVDESGATVEIGGAAAVCPARGRTIQKAALADGLVTIQGEMAALTAEVAQGARAHAAAMQAWALIPADEGQ